MPELKRNFTKGRMNKDLDERMVPNGEYRDALNVEVSTSESSNVGTIQTLKGNTDINTGTVLSNLTLSSSLFSNSATCVGSIVNEKSNKLYWFVTDSDINYDASWYTGSAANDTHSQAELDASGTVSVIHKVYSDYILEHDDNTKESNWIAVENYKVETIVSNDSDATGDHIHISSLGTNGDIRRAGIQVGMEVYINNMVTSVIKIVKASSYNGWRVYTEHAAASTGYAGLANIVAGDDIRFVLPYDKRALGFSHFAATKPKKLITGINIIDNLLFWTDSLTEPKKINIERCRYGSQQADIATYSDYGTRKFPTLLIVNGDIPSSANYRLALETPFPSAILYPFLSYQHTTVIRKSPTTPLTLTMSNSESNKLQVGLLNDGVLVVSSDISLPLNNTNGVQSSNFFFSGNGTLLPTGTTLDPLTFLNVIDWVEGDIVEFYPNDDEAGFENEALVIAVVVSVSNGTTFEFEIQSRSTNVIKPFTKWTVKLQKKKPLFEFKFPRFAYRWRYEDGEYSTYSPFSEVAFLPEKFDYLPKKGFNLGMTNNLRYLLLSNFKPITTPLDVVEIDILYKESNSANVYTVETIKSPSVLVDSLNTVDFEGDDGWKGEITNGGVTVEAPNTLTTQSTLVDTNTLEGTVLVGTGQSFGITNDFGDTNLKVGDTLSFPNITSGLNAPIIITGVTSSFTSGVSVSYISLTHNGVAVTDGLGSGSWNSPGTVIQLHRDIAIRPAVYVDHPQGSLEIKTDMIHATLPSNQLLRPWDNVPKKALAQDITGNRVVYGNYTQNYDLTDTRNKVVKQKFNVVPGRRKNIPENVKYDDRTALRNPTTGLVIPWYDSLNTINPVQTEPERSIKSIRDYQIGVIYSDEFGRQTPVQTHETGAFSLKKNRANDYNTINVKLENYNWPKWATHYKYYLKENANEYYNLAMDRFYDAEDGNIWLSFPSSERNKVDEETFLILKKQHDSDIFVSDPARYKILAIENEAPLFVKTVMSSRGIVSIGTFPAAGQPKIDQQHVDVPGSHFSSGGTFDGVIDGDKETVIRISNATTISAYYDVQKITTYGGNKRITVRKSFGSDMSFTTDDGTNTGSIATNLSFELAQKEVKTLPEFEGRFFAKIYKDSVLEKNILVNKPAKKFIATATMVLGHQDNIYDYGANWGKGGTTAPTEGAVPKKHFFVSHENPKKTFGPGNESNHIATGMTNNRMEIQIHWGAGDISAAGDNYGITLNSNNFGVNSALLDQAKKFKKKDQLWRFKGDTTVYRVTFGTEWMSLNYHKTSKNASNHSVCLRMNFFPNIGSTGLDAVGVLCTGYDPRQKNAEGTSPGGTYGIPTTDYWDKSKPMKKDDTRTIEFLEEFIGDSSYTSDNPAIWETEPKENVDIDLYNEASTCYPIEMEWNPYLNKFDTSFGYHNSWNPLSYYNCFSFANGVESNRIRDDFNAVVIDKGPKVSTVLAEQYREEERKSGLIYSGIYNSTSGINRLNQFIQAEKITKDLNPTYGSIQKLWSKDTNLVTFCEDRVIGVLANKDALFNADGNSNVTATSNVLGAATPYAGDYGISTDPESFAVDQYRAYFTDKSRGAVIRISQNGLTPISDMGMRDYFKDVFKSNNLSLVGSYDDNKKLYNLTMQGLPVTAGEPLTPIVSPITTSGTADFISFADANAIGTIPFDQGGYPAVGGDGTGPFYTGSSVPYAYGVIGNPSTTFSNANGNGVQAFGQYDANDVPSAGGGGGYGPNVTQIHLPLMDWYGAAIGQFDPPYPIESGIAALINALDNCPNGDVYLHAQIQGGGDNGSGEAPTVYQSSGAPIVTFKVNSIVNTGTRYELNVTYFSGLHGGNIDTYYFWYSTSGCESGVFSNTGSDDIENNGLGYMETTASYSEDSKGWTSFKSWLQEFGVSLNDKYFTFNTGNLYQHHSNETRNSFYGTEYDSTVCVIFNDMPSSVKTFSSLSYEGTQSRVVINTDDEEYYNNTANDGWFASTITSDLETGFIPEFKDKEGKWFNYIRGNQVNNLENLNVTQFSTQGIGRPSAISTTLDPIVEAYKLTIQDTGDID